MAVAEAVHNGKTFSDIDETVEKALTGKGEYEVRVQIVSNGGVILHTFPHERIVQSVSRKCATYDEAVAVYDDARKQLGSE
jgi:hypothetical protein